MQMVILGRAATDIQSHGSEKATADCHGFFVLVISGLFNSTAAQYVLHHRQQFAS
jgi:hypothetical protein